MERPVFRRLYSLKNAPDTGKEALASRLAAEPAAGPSARQFFEGE
jgi:hypothetical protein